MKNSKVPTNNKIEPIAEKTQDKRVYPLAGMNIVQCWCSNEKLPAYAHIAIDLDRLAEIRAGYPYTSIRRFSCGHKVRVTFKDS